MSTHKIGACYTGAMENVKRIHPEISGEEGKPQHTPENIERLEGDLQKLFFELREHKLALIKRNETEHNDETLSSRLKKIRSIELLEHRMSHLQSLTKKSEEEEYWTVWNMAHALLDKPTHADNVISLDEHRKKKAA